MIDRRIAAIEKKKKVEYIQVWVNGRQKKCKIDHDANDCKSKDLATILNKDNCNDIFLNIKKIVND